MNKYLFKATYTPDDPACDRQRQRVVIEESDVMAAMPKAMDEFGFEASWTEVLAGYLDAIRDEDTSEGFEWNHTGTNGEWDFEWYPHDAKDPVTKESILAWAETQAADADDPEAVRVVLICVLGRQYWRTISEWGSFDMREALHSLMVEGDTSTPYSKMTIDQLLTETMEAVVENAEDCYDGEEPFGISTMVEDDKALWLDEQVD